MTTERDLLRAICEHPDEDTPRLMFADFLDERGDAARAAFIRAQVEFAATAPADPLYRYAVWRNMRCERTTGTALTAALPKLRGVDFGPLVRGFVQDLHADDYRALKRHAATVFGTFPIRSLRVRQLSEPVLLADMPELRFIRRLALVRCTMTPAALGTLLASPHLTNLASIDLDLVPFGDALVAVLAGAAPTLPALREVYLCGCNLTDASAVWLGRDEAFDTLRVLDLSFNALTGAGGHELASATRLSNIERLVLKGYSWQPSVRRHLRTRFKGVEL